MDIVPSARVLFKEKLGTLMKILSVSIRDELEREELWTLEKQETLHVQAKVIMFISLADGSTVDITQSV